MTDSDSSVPRAESSHSESEFEKSESPEAKNGYPSSANPSEEAFPRADVDEEGKVSKGTSRRMRRSNFSSRKRRLKASRLKKPSVAANSAAFSSDLQQLRSACDSRLGL